MQSEQYNTYAQKLESHFHPAFLAMEVNQKSKKYEPLRYIEMLEQMCKERGIEVKREPFNLRNNFIYIQDQYGNIKEWTVEEETKTTYKIFHLDLITQISKSKVFESDAGHLLYEDSIRVPEDCNRMCLEFYKELQDALLWDSLRFGGSEE
jgi:hypothetical protein